MKTKKFDRTVLIKKRGLKSAAVAAVLAAIVTPGAGFAHGFEGDRFFPPTIALDDPFATDELLLPSLSYFRSPPSDGVPTVGTLDLGFEFDKEIFPKFALGISGDYLFQKPDSEHATSGFDNFSLSAKYQLGENAPHEAILSVGGEWEIGGSGSKQAGADPRSSFTPTIYFGKGLGDLPDAVKYLKPFAITGTVGENIPDSSDSDALQWGFSVEYSLPYLQSQVRDIGLPRVLKSMIPLVEFSMNTPENRHGGETTGTINPGVLYENTYFQLGAEAILPLNRASGNDIGGIVQLQIYIDDIWPNLFGHPIFGTGKQTSGPF